MTTDEKFDLILSKLDTMDKRLDTIENRLDKLEQKQLETQVTLENTINKCIDALGEGFSLNAERLDRFNVETIKTQAELAFALAKVTNEKVEQLTKKIKTA